MDEESIMIDSCTGTHLVYLVPLFLYDIPV